MSKSFLTTAMSSPSRAESSLRATTFRGKLMRSSRRARRSFRQRGLDLARTRRAQRSLPIFEHARFDIDIDANTARVTAHEQLGAHSPDGRTGAHLGFEASDADRAD